MFTCVFVTFPCRILCQVLYLIVSIPDLCHLYYFYWNVYCDKTYRALVTFGFVVSEL